MRSAGLALCLGLALPGVQASERWIFDSRIAVTAEPVDGLFHHLEGAGRRHIAVSSGSVAVTWEDNRGRDPQVYVARKSNRQSGFSDALQVSYGGEAYEPAIASLPGDRYLLAWEQDGEVHARVLADAGLGLPARLASSEAGQVSVTSTGDRAYAIWRERRGGDWFVKVASLRSGGDNGLIVESITAVESRGLQSPVLYPAIAVNGAGLCIAWEDRRAGHTRLLFSHSSEAARSFAAPQHLNEFFSGRNQYDQGSGVTRVSLAAFAQDEYLAAWMDKRRGGLGYGIFAALGAGDGAGFGPNEKVHSADGDGQPHYNPATAGNADGDFVVAWDDFRRGDADIWLSAHDREDEWSPDFNPPVAGGGGEQSHPSLALDEAGNLHLLWIERGHPDAPSRLWYSRGLRAEGQ
jgi:hypothetical protein